MPSVLIELGYVSNKQDLKLMTSDAWRARTSEAVAQAVNTFFSTRLAGSGPGAGRELALGRCGDEAAGSLRSGSAKPQFDHKTARVSLLPCLLTDWFGAHIARSPGWMRVSSGA